MSSHLGGFNYKSNKCHKDYFTNVTKIISQRLTKSGVGERAHKGLEISVFREWHQHPPKEGGENVLYLSPKIKSLGTSQ
jgi:hypothetical protein